MQTTGNLDDIFRSRDFAALRENLSQLTPRDLAELIGDAPTHEPPAKSLLTLTNSL